MAKERLTKEERVKLKTALIGENSKNALAFQAWAIGKFGPPAGVMLRQLIFHEGKQRDEDGWIYKSRREMKDETGLNQKQQEKARKSLKAAGVLEEDLRLVGSRKTRHYRVDLRSLVSLRFPPDLKAPTSVSSSLKPHSESCIGNPIADHVPERPCGFRSLQESTSRATSTPFLKNSVESYTLSSWNCEEKPSDILPEDHEAHPSREIEENPEQPQLTSPPEDSDLSRSVLGSSNSSSTNRVVVETKILPPDCASSPSPLALASGMPDKVPDGFTRKEWDEWRRDVAKMEAEDKAELAAEEAQSVVGEPQVVEASLSDQQHERHPLAVGAESAGGSTPEGEPGESGDRRQRSQQHARLQTYMIEDDEVWLLVSGSRSVRLVGRVPDNLRYASGMFAWVSDYRYVDEDGATYEVIDGVRRLSEESALEHGADARPSA